MKKYFLSVIIILSSQLAVAELPPLCGLVVLNIHENNPDLESFSIQQHPSWDKDQKIYNKGHPYIVFYKFKTGLDHIVFFSASGQVLGGEWEKLPKEHWVKFEPMPLSSLYHECRGTNDIQSQE